ncbi:MAG: MerR family transcriptional regulator [Roseburia sp.]|nr:MerR family transcriptional regulator [Roseburia sp.]
MKTVNEISKLTGVSVRTLHYYDAIGLLHPTETTGAGYRLYDDTSLCRLQNILMFRELQFPLKEIKKILDSPVFDPEEALDQQIQLLELQKSHIEELISFAREIKEKGVRTMNFEAFSKSEMEQYAKEVTEKWGTTKAYEEYQEKTKQKNGEEFEETAKKLMDIFSEIGTMKELSPADSAVQEKIGALQAFITDNYYRCTPEILKGLGEMYVEDERFRRNIDSAGGEGTAAFVREAIFVFCQ